MSPSAITLARIARDAALIGRLHRGALMFTAITTMEESERLLLARRRLLLNGARSTEEVGQPVVALVAGVLVERLIRLHHRNLYRPRFGPRRRIVHREFVQQRVGVHPLEPLGQPEIRSGIRECGLT